jgi:hypothetical protein
VRAVVNMQALPLTSGYIQRAKAYFPKQGTKAPWRAYNHFVVDWCVTSCCCCVSSIRFTENNHQRRSRVLRRTAKHRRTTECVVLLARRYLSRTASLDDGYLTYERAARARL